MNTKVVKRDFKETIRKIRQTNIEPVYFLNGDDYYLQMFFIHEVEKYLSKKQKVERIFLIPEITDFPQIVAELNSVGLFPEPKLFILQNPTRIKGQLRKELLQYCKSPIENNCLIIVIDKYDPKMKLISDISAILGVINTSPPYPNKIIQWVNFLLDHNNLNATSSAIEKLAELCGDSVYHISNEIEKMKIGLGDKDSVSESDVLRFVGWKRKYYPWHFLDAIGNKKYIQAVNIGKSLLSEGTDISILISKMTLLFQEILFHHLKNGEGGGKVDQIGWLGGNITRNLSKYKIHYSKEELGGIFHYLALVDQKTKTSRFDSLMLLQPLLYKILMNNDG
ncbi:MAG: DNA polymerase III subunit delta [Candidatus Marinimicrobia bacterium]|nr:DNA polymerase III subunit delta [Candidatus Neomarinimicrobiota bacterium]